MVASGLVALPAPGKFDLGLYRGDSYTWRVVLWQDAAHTEPVDLTGADAAAEIRKSSGALGIMALACVVTAPNIVDVELAAGLWTDSPGPTGAWDLQLTFPTGEVRTVLRGAVTVTADITDSVTQLGAI